LLDKIPAVSMHPVEHMGGAAAAPVDLFSIFAAVLRRWKLIFAVTLFALSATYGVLKLVPSLYKSTTQILVFDPQRQMDEAVQKRISPFVDAVDINAMNTEIEVIKSKSVTLRVARELGLDKDPEFQPRSSFSVLTERFGLTRLGGSDDGHQSVGDPDEESVLRLDQAAEALLGKVQVERLLFSYILAVSVTSQDPSKAQRLAAAVANNYLAGQREARQDALQRVAAWLKGRVDDLQSRVLETETSIEKLKAESDISDTGFNNVSEQQIAQLTEQLTNTRAEVADKQAHLEQAQRLIESNGDLQAIPELTRSAAMSQLRQQQAEVNWRIGILSKNLGEHHDKVIAARTQLEGINKQIGAEADHLLANLKSAYDIAVRREQSVEASLQKLTAARGNPATYIKLQQLRRVADADRKLYESYLSQFNEISQRRTLQDASARIIAPATLPSSPSSPRRTLFYALAGIFGLGCGCLLAFLLEYLHAGVRTSAEVEESSGYRVVGLIPLVEHQKRRRIPYDRLLNKIAEAPLSQFSEAVHAMRIGLELSGSDRAPKVILLTSSLPGEGKSTAAMLLAASSATSGRRTVLIDCDLRRPSTSVVFGNKQQPGLSELLRGTTELMDVISKDSATSIYVIPAGSIVASPANLLMSERMRDLIAELREEFEYIVMDASPLLPVVDALALAIVADKILVVVEWNHTPTAIVREALKMLTPQAHRVAGIVLNKVDLKQMQGYGYRGGYHYRSVGKYFSNA
jgi:polysaccharide biosynthesis transport protein